MDSIEIDTGNLSAGGNLSYDLSKIENYQHLVPFNAIYVTNLSSNDLKINIDGKEFICGGMSYLKISGLNGYTINIINLDNYANDNKIMISVIKGENK